MSAGAAGAVALGDRQVARLGFGAMRLCGPGVTGRPADVPAALAVLRRAVELGVELIDTADAYGPEVSEELVAEALHPYPAQVVVATKGGLVRRGPRWLNDGRPEHLRAACEGSLRRLRVDAIDVYQLHAPDDRVPFADSVGALAELRDAGKVRHVGLSNVTLDQLRTAQAIVPIASVQNQASLGNRSSDDVLAACGQDGIAFLPYRPLDRGRAGRVATGVGTRLGATPRQVALAWLLARSPVVAPIPGTSQADHLESNVAAAELRLDDADLAELTAAV